MKRRVVITHLQMRSPDELRSAKAADVVITQAELPAPEFARFLYTAVGGDWFWTERLTWSYNDWLTYLSRPGFELWVAYVRGTPAGYFELERGNDGDVEIKYFGLLPAFIGQGYGGHLLSECVRRAWALGGQRVLVHTNTLDGPNALPNYLARGFRIAKETVSMVDLPDAPPGPWPASGKKV